MEELQEEVLDKFPDTTFVTYKDMRVFYEFKAEHEEWFVIIYRLGETTGYPCLGCTWTKSKEEAINWGVDKIDEFLATHTKTERGWLPNFLLNNKKPTPHK